MRGEHEIDPAVAHRFDQRQHVPTRDAEAAADAGGLEHSDDQVGIVHRCFRRNGIVHRCFRRNGKGPLQIEDPDSCREHIFSILFQALIFPGILLSVAFAVVRFS